tara:strand:+ start:290 stop:571 length:282 start_codon:yes stop_codon:yes gene_type:complete
MSFVNKLNNTYELLDKFDEVIIEDKLKNAVKTKLLSISEDLAGYKDLNEKNINLKNKEIKSKINDVLNKLNEIEIIVKNKLIIIKKYNSYLNS